MSRQQQQNQQRAAQRIQSQQPPIQAPGQVIETREPDRRFWPEGKPMPEYYERPRQPCPECKRVALDDGGQAVALAQSGKDVVYLRCKSCGHRWKMGRVE